MNLNKIECVGARWTRDLSALRCENKPKVVYRAFESIFLWHNFDGVLSIDH